MHECPKCHRDCQCDGSSGTDGGGPKGMGSIAAGACAHDCAKDAAKPVTARFAASTAHATDHAPAAPASGRSAEKHDDHHRQAPAVAH